MSSHVARANPRPRPRNELREYAVLSPTWNRQSNGQSKLMPAFRYSLVLPVVG